MSTSSVPSARAASVRSLLTRFAVVAFLVAGTGLVLGKLAVDAVIRQVDQDELRDELKRADLAFARIARRARLQVENFAYRDETVRLALKPDAPGAAEFFRRDFVEWLPVHEYEFLELLDGRRHVAFTWSAAQEVRPPADLVSSPFLDSLTHLGSVGGYVRAGNQVYLVGAAAIRRTEPGDGVPGAPSHGFLLIGRAMAGEAVASLARDLQLGVQVLPAETALPATPQHSVVFAGADSVRAYFRLSGALGDEAAVVEILESRSGVHRISRWTLVGALAGLLFGAGAFLMVWRYGRRLLITPLRGIAQEIETMHQRGELSTVSSAAPSAEWALFLETFNETVKSLRDSEQRYTALFDSAADPYLLLDAATGVVVDANPAAAALIGEPRERLVGSPQPATLRAQPESAGAVRVRRPDGTVRTWGVVETAVRIGERRLLLAAYRDITDREALAQSQKMDAVGSLAGGIAHDFNNLMGSVLAGARVARDSLPTDRRGASALDAIEHAGRRAADLTRQLLSFSRHDPLVRVPVDVGAAIANIERMCTSTFDRRVRIEAQAPPDLPTIDGDPGQVEQALLNLCINARDAMPQGGTLRISAQTEQLDATAALSIRDIQPGAYVVLSVADDGVGMTDDVKQRIFEPFFTTKANGQGTGLGLSMVYGLVHSAGGTMVVDSAPGRGTRFDLYLPVSREPAARTAATIVRPPAPSPASPEPVARRGQSPTERTTVLVADDEPGLREMLRLVLEHEGYEVLEAANGSEANQLFDAHREDISAVLLDVQMPVLGGIEVCAHIRSVAPDLLVILTSGYVGDAELAMLRDAGATSILTKPYEMRELLDRLAAVAPPRVAPVG